MDFSQKRKVFQKRKLTIKDNLQQNINIIQTFWAKLQGLRVLTKQLNFMDLALE